MLVTKYRRKSQSVAGIDIRDPSLVFYVPLWHPGLADSPFKSKDLTPDTCTVTGVVWGATGRTFDGSDDKISMGTSAPAFGASSYTVVAWVYHTSTAYAIVASQYDNASSILAGWNLRINNDDTINFRGVQHATDQYWVATTTETISLNVWHHIVAMRDLAADTLRVYMDMVPLTLTLSQSAGVNHAANLDSAAERLIGAMVNGAGYAFFFKGVIGEQSWYTRALSLAEIQRNYQATKWRYN